GEGVDLLREPAVAERAELTPRARIGDVAVAVGGERGHVRLDVVLVPVRRVGARRLLDGPAIRRLERGGEPLLVAALVEDGLALAEEAGGVRVEGEALGDRGLRRVLGGHADPLALEARLVLVGPADLDALVAAVVVHVGERGELVVARALRRLQAKS